MDLKKLKMFSFEICFFVGFTIFATTLFQKKESRGSLSSSADVTSLDERSIFIGNAGCMIKKNGKVLLVEQLSGKLGTPGGTAEKGETAVETAIREVFEETQFKVRPKKLLKLFNNGFYLFECVVLEEPSEIAPTPSFIKEIKSAGFYDVNSLTAEDLRFPYQYKIYSKFQNSNI